MATPTSGLTWAAPLGTATDPITWAFAAPGNATGLGTVTSAISDPNQQAAVTAGINEWAQVSGLHLEQVSNPTQANIQIGYGEPSGLLGQDIWAYNPQTSQFTSDLVLLDDPADHPLTSNNGQLTYADGVTLQQLATHETGVGLGLAEGDGSDANSIMNHVLDASNQVPDAADIAAIDSLYGPPATSTAPTGTAPAPGSGGSVAPDKLTLLFSEDAYKGNAQFVAKIDGKQVGTGSVTALHSLGQTQSFTYTGSWGAGLHDLEIDFTNDAYGGSRTADRNLYVNGVTYDGSSSIPSGSFMTMDGNGAVHFAIGQP